MRALFNSVLATLFVLVLLLVVPLVAVFGIPEFLPAVASSSNTTFGADGPLRPLDPGIGESAGYVPNDLFAPFDESAAPFGDEFAVGGRTPLPPRESLEQPPAVRHRTPSNVPLDGWEFDQRGRAVPLVDDAPLADPGGRSRVEPASLAFEGDAVPVDRPRPPSGSVIPGASRSAPTPFVGATPSSLGGPAERPIAAAEGAAEAEPFRRVRDNRSDDPNPDRVTNEQAEFTWTAAVGRLRDLGIHDYQLTPGRNGRDFHFACAWSPDGNARVRQRFEAEAGEPLQAVRKVIAQIEDWSSRPR